MSQLIASDPQLRCSICKASLTLSSVKDHKKHHHAMRIMRFKHGNVPRDMESLSKRRKTLTRKILMKFMNRTDDPQLLKRLERIDEAYETLLNELTKDDVHLKSLLLQDGKTSMRDGYFEERDRVQEDVVRKDSIHTYKTHGYPSCVYGIGKSQILNKDWRDQMEDRISVAGGLNISPLNNPCYIGVFDGHHGSTSAQTCSETLSSYIAEEMNSFRTNQKESEIILSAGFSSTSIDDDDSLHERLGDLEISSSISKAFVKMDNYLGYGINEKSRVRWSGCSALTCLISDHSSDVVSDAEKEYSLTKVDTHGTDSASEKAAHMKEHIGQAYISNTGNIKAVLYRDRNPIVLNRIHTLSNQEEVTRISRVGDALNTSRSIETTRGLGNHGDLNLKKCVIPVPQTSAVKVTRDCQFLVIATNSLWEVLNPNDVFAIILHHIPPDAMTVLKMGPMPIIPVVHGSLSVGNNGDGDGHRLPSIVETEEDEAIEEVIFVDAQDSDSEDEQYETAEFASRGDGNLSDSSGMKKSGGERQRNPKEHFDGCVSSGDGPDNNVSDKEALLRTQYADIATDLSSRLVRAAVEAGAVENVSAVVVLFEGLFRQ